VERLGSSASPRLAGLGSSCPSTVPRTLTPTPLPRPLSEPEVLGLVGAAPSTLLVGPQTRRLLPLRDPLRPPSLLAPPPPQWVPRLPSTPGRSTPQWAPKGAHIGEVRQRSRGLVPRPGIIVVAAIVVLPQDRLGGRLLEWEPVKALLMSALLQCLLLLGLADLTLLGGVFLLFLLGRQEASSLPSDPIFWKRRPRFLNHR
jgi:hypothetical protein